MILHHLFEMNECIYKKYHICTFWTETAFKIIWQNSEESYLVIQGPTVINEVQEMKGCKVNKVI
jgi:hypothetical protein